MPQNLKLGCDPEVFLQDVVSGTLTSAIGKIGGTKAYPEPLPLGDGYAVQEDNVAMEFNIPPASNAKQFVESIQNTLNFLEGVVRDNYGYKISHLSAASFPEKELDNPAAKVFGCDPDFNAWTGRRNPSPRSSDASLRSCGGHVHIGLPESINRVTVIKAMDLFLGIPSVLMDTGELRKQLYGKAGAYREKSYGVEYRTMSNFWIFNKDLIEWVWRNTERAVAAVESQLPLDELRGPILTAINRNDKELATNLVHEYGLEVLHV